MVSTEEILRKYGSKIESQIGSSPQSYSSEYLSFKKDMLPEFSRYQRWAEALGSLIKIKPSAKEAIKLEKSLRAAHLEVTASQAVTLAATSFLLTFIVTSLIVTAIYFVNGSFQTLLLFLGIITSLFVFYYVYTMPARLANAWRLKASSQMVPAILYIVIYMKHTSNFEKAIEFASQHLEKPLALDFRKIFWDVEVGRFSNVKQSIDNYLESWREYAPEFVESFHLIESSLFEPEEARRVQTLEKALQVILDGVYEKMLRYSRDIRTPLTNLYMLGIILPTLGLALLPLASTLLGGLIEWHHVFILFNIIIPFFVFYMTSEVLLRRPGGYGESSIVESNPNYAQFISKKPFVIAFIVCFPIFVLGLLPFLFQVNMLTQPLGLQSDYAFSDFPISFFENNPSMIFDFKVVDKKTIGPFGPVALLLSLCIPLSVSLFFAMAYKMKTKELIKSREATKELEQEFTNSLFQLANRLGDGVPAEIAFSRVASTTQGLKTQNFFSLVNTNIQQQGLSIEDAIFNKNTGALVYYPSALIATSMRILIESARKGLAVAARSLMSISEYVKNIHKIDERLRDLLAEVVSDMKSNMTFLAPLLAGIVIGLAAMITTILNKLASLTTLNAEQEAAGFGSLGNILSLFDVKTMVPPYFLQVSIGLYLVEIAFILTGALVTVDAGRDPLREKYDLSHNLKRAMYLYLGTALIAILILSVIATIALGSLA